MLMMSEQAPTVIVGMASQSVRNNAALHNC